MFRNGPDLYGWKHAFPAQSCRHRLLPPPPPCSLRLDRPCPGRRGSRAGPGREVVQQRPPARYRLAGAQDVVASQFPAQAGESDAAVFSGIAGHRAAAEQFVAQLGRQPGVTSVGGFSWPLAETWPMPRSLWRMARRPARADGQRRRGFGPPVRSDGGLQRRPVRIGERSER